jgi:hypothetical protein
MKCSVCGFESERHSDFLVSDARLCPESATRKILVEHFGTDYLSVCVVCAFKAIGVPTKGKPEGRLSEIAKAQGECEAKRAEANVKAASPLPDGYKVITQETFVKETFEWTPNQAGNETISGVIVFDKIDVDFISKIIKYRGTRTYRLGE